MGPDLSAAENYAALVDAVEAQRARLQGSLAQEDRWTGPLARTFRFDPHRELDANLTMIASHVGPEDVLMDVGGGAGRICLPLSLRCREVISVEPSAGMREEFSASAAEAGIKNARLVPSRWPPSEDLEADVAVSADVTYFVRDIIPFIESLEAASRRRVMLIVWSEPPPNRRAEPFRLVYGEELAPVPGHTHLLPVLWEMGILPDLRVMPLPPWWESDAIPTREEAVQLELQSSWIMQGDQEYARGILEAHFDDLFGRKSDGYHPLWRKGMRELLITWETGRRG